MAVKGKSKGKLEPGFKQFLIKTGLFVVGFIFISLIIGQGILDNGLLYTFSIYIYGGMGKILLFSIVGFVLLYRDRLLKLESFEYNKKNLFWILVSSGFVLAFYFLEHNIGILDVNILSKIFLHFVFLSMFIFLLMGIYSFKFLKSFFREFRRELLYFLVFGIIVYSLMNTVWKLWPVLSHVVTWAVSGILRIIGNVNFMGQYTIAFDGFAAEIGEACSGVYSIFLFTAIYLFAIILDFKKINLKKASLIFIPAIIGAFLVNIFRVSLLFVVGAYLSRDLALGLYHSYVGMIFFLIYFSLFWVFFYDWMKRPEFRKKKEKGFFGKKWERVMKDSLYRNSIYLMLNTLIMSFFGFIFWMVASRLYSAQDIGLATALISVMGLIVGLSVLGLNVGLIRYLPTSRDKNKKINTAFTLVTLSTIVVTCIFIMFSGFLAPKLMFIHDNIFMAFIFMAMMIVASVNSLMEAIFTAYRATKNILLKNTVFSILKILGLFGFVWLGAFGIFSSWMISMGIGILVVAGVLFTKFHYRFRFNFYDSILKQMGSYSFGNYVAGFIGGLPLLILPILILNNLGSEMVAYYYMAMMIATLLFVIPQATSQSLFAEGSYDEKNLKAQVSKAIRIIGWIMVPAILITVLVGKYVLMMFGPEYAEQGFRFLQILAVSGVFISGYRVFEGILKVKGRIKVLIILGIVNALMIIGLGSVLMRNLGLFGVGLGWMIGYFVSFCVMVGFVRK